MMLAGIVLAAAFAAAERPACTMRAPALEARRISHDPAVRAVVSDKAAKRLAVMLKDGTQLRITSMGCEHAGLAASIWIAEAPKNVDQILTAATPRMRIAFGKLVSVPIEKAIAAKNYQVQNDAGETYISVTTEEELFVGIRSQKLADGTILYIEYIYP